MTSGNLAQLDPAWHDAIPRRISRRRFTGEPVPDAAMSRLAAVAESFRPCAEVRAAIVDNSATNVFMGWVGSYGRIEGAPSALLLIAPRGYGEGVGYAGEGLILEATRLGIGTCWVAGNFSRRRAARLVELHEHEHVLSASPLGIPVDEFSAGERAIRGLVAEARRKPLDVIAPGAESGSWPHWALDAVRAARLAPSGSNRQPWRFRLEEGSLVLTCPPAAYFTANIDRGIAKLHVELGAAHAGVAGTWERLDAPGSLRFVPTGAAASPPA